MCADSLFHDDLVADEGEFTQWRGAYTLCARAVRVALSIHLDVLRAVERRAQACGRKEHATAVMLMYEFAEPIDGVAILAERGSARNCPQLLRTALEIVLALHYILEDDASCARRSLAYRYFDLDGGLKLAQKLDPDHPNGKHLRVELADDPFSDIIDALEKEIDVKAEVRKCQTSVGSPRYAEVRDEIDRMKRKEETAATKQNKRRHGSPSKWFSLWDGPKDVRSLARRVNMLSLYEFLYRSWSNVGHGGAAFDRISGRAANGTPLLDPIRSPKDLKFHCGIACNLTSHLSLALVDKLVPHLREDLRGWHAGRMKPALDAMSGVQLHG